MIDISRFLRLRPEGCASVTKVFDPPDLGVPIFHLVFKRFNPENGKELDPERQLIVEQEMLVRRAVLSSELEAIDAILSEMRGLE